MDIRKLKYLLSVISALMISTAAGAQFYLDGDDDGRLRWSEITTSDYRIIYPEGLDSLASVYARYLEQCKLPVSGSIGSAPNEAYRTPFPVILHSGSVRSNGMVTWTPRRMELMTCPDPIDPESNVWPLQLTIHESRHVAQMQFTHQGILKYLGWGFGEFIPGVFSALASAPVFYEGDAVLAETALTEAGRGRTADFLEYYRASFSEGDKRNYWQWLYGSLDKYTPDYYKIGYISLAGMKALYGFEKWPLQPLRSDIAKAFPAIADSLSCFWRNDALKRRPYQPWTRLTPESERFVSYGGTVCIGGMLYSIQKGPDQNTRLVRIDRFGEVTVVCPFSSETSRLCGGGGKLYWSEVSNDTRWSQKSYSDIWCMPSPGKRVRLTRNDRLFNPCISGDGKMILATRYSTCGRSSAVVLDSSDGSEIQCWDAPDSLQIVEAVWNGRDIYASCISSHGFSIYRVPDFEALFAPRQFKVNHLGARDGDLQFVCDLDGSDQLYSLPVERGSSPVRITSSPEGATDYAWSTDGTLLYMSVLSSGGRAIFQSPSDSLPSRPADFSVLHEYPFVSALAGKEKIHFSDTAEIAVSAPKRYRKLAHLFNFHSWAPAYVDINTIDALSSFNLYQDLGIGATAFFQNHLGTSYGSIGWKAWDISGGWRNRLSVKYTYTGLYPVIEASVNVNDKDAEAYRYWLSKTRDSLFCMQYDIDKSPYISGNLNVYIPLDFSSGGWSRGVIPNASFSLNNDIYNFPPVEPALINRYCLSVRAYNVQQRASNAIYPKLGIGTEIGVSGRIGLSGHFGTNLYSQVYAYLPGFLRNHGIKIAATGQKVCGNPYFIDPYANTMPRGFRTMGETANECFSMPLQGKIAIDYSFPFGSAGSSFLCPFAYIKNFEGNIHYDAAAYGTSQKTYYTLSSWGVRLSARLGNLLWIPYETGIGLSYDHSYKNSLSLYFTIDL